MSETIIEKLEDFGLSKKKNSINLFSKIGIVGCGSDGQYIARVCSSYGIEVIVIEQSGETIDWALNSIAMMMDQRIANWGATETEKRAVMSRIKGSTDYHELKGCDMVIEAVRTNDKGRSLSSRRKVFEIVEKVVSPDCIIATNSTTIVVSELSENLIHKERCVSIHFMINSTDSRIVEVTPGMYTSQEVVDKVCQFVKMIKRRVIPVAESVGLISVRMLTVMLNEACDMVIEGVGTMNDIEQLMITGYGMRFGPFYLADLMGLDKVVRWMENLFNEFGEVKYKPNPLIKRLVRQCHYGVSTGKGFYCWDEKGNRILN